MTLFPCGVGTSWSVAFGKDARYQALAVCRGRGCMVHFCSFRVQELLRLARIRANAIHAVLCWSSEQWVLIVNACCFRFIMVLKNRKGVILWICGSLTVGGGSCVCMRPSKLCRGCVPRSSLTSRGSAPFLAYARSVVCCRPKTMSSVRKSTVCKRASSRLRTSRGLTAFRLATAQIRYQYVARFRIVCSSLCCSCDTVSQFTHYSGPAPCRTLKFCFSFPPSTPNHERHCTPSPHTFFTHGCFAVPSHSPSFR